MNRNLNIYGQRKARSRPISFLWTVAAAAMSFTIACGGKDPKAAGPQAPPAMPVKVQTARSVAVNDTTEYIATLKSRDSAVIMPQVEGQVTEILVRSGDRVSAGQPLMQIDPAKQQATVKSQEDTRAARLASLEFAKQQYERVHGLFAAG